MGRLGGMRGMEADHVGGLGKSLEVDQIDAEPSCRQRIRIRVICHDAHVENAAQFGEPPPDPAKADDAERRPLKVAYVDRFTLGPSTLADQLGERPEPLDEVQDECQRPFRHSVRAGVRRDDDGDPPLVRAGEVDEIDPDAAPSNDTQVWCGGDEPTVDDAAAAGDQADGHR